MNNSFEEFKSSMFTSTVAEFCRDSGVPNEEFESNCGPKTIAINVYETGAYVEVLEDGTYAAQLMHDYYCDADVEVIERHVYNWCIAEQIFDGELVEEIK